MLGMFLRRGKQQELPAFQADENLDGIFNFFSILRFGTKRMVWREIVVKAFRSFEMRRYQRVGEISSYLYLMRAS